MFHSGREVEKMRGRSALILKIVGILGPLLLIYWQDLEIVAGDAINSEVMNYILIIPFFIAYALYRKRRMLRAVIPLENAKEIRNTEVIVGVSLLLTTFILHWYGSYTFYPVEYHLISMPIFLAGAILLVYNWQTLRQLLFPLITLLLLEPLPLQVADMAGFQISALSSIAAYNLLKLIGLPVELTILQTPVITIETVQGAQLPLAVDVACSGLYSLTGFAAFAVFATFITRGPSWKRTVLFSIGFPMIYGLNILRIASIIWIAHGWGEGVAMQTFHLLGGSMLIFIATLLILTLGDKIGKLKIFTARANQEPCILCNESLMKGENFCLYCGKFIRSLAIILVACALSCLSLVTSGILLSIGTTRIVMESRIIGIVTEILLSLLLIIPPLSLGIVGAAMGRSALMIISFVYMFVRLKRIMSFDVDFGALKNAWIASGAMTVGLILFQLAWMHRYLLPFYIAIGAAIYFMTLRVLHAVTPQDVNLIEAYAPAYLQRFIQALGSIIS